MVTGAGNSTDARLPRDLLREVGLRITPQRQLIIDVLGDEAAGASRHLTADEIWQLVSVRYDNINRSTVYRVLDSLVGAGLVVQHMLGAVAHYELESAMHHHLVCQRCHAVFDLPAADLRRLVSAARAAHGFVVGGVGVTIEGVCAACAGVEAGL